MVKIGLPTCKLQRPRAIDVLCLGNRLPCGGDVVIENIKDFRPGGRFRGSKSIGTGPPDGAISSDGVFRTMTSQLGMSATWLAFQPIVCDLG